MSEVSPEAPPQDHVSPGGVFHRAISSLRISRDFRYLWLSNLFFAGGGWALILILGWYVFETTQSEVLLAIFTALRLSPMWFGPISGLIADRYNRVTIIKIASVWSFAIVILLAVLVGVDAAPYPVLLLGGWLLGMVVSPSQPSRSSLMLQLVGRKNLPNANALITMAMGLMGGIAPAVAGYLISQFGVTVALWTSSIWYLAATLCIWRIEDRKQNVVHAASEPIIPMLTNGLHLILKNRLTTTVIVITLAANFLIFPVYNSFMPVFASDVLKLDAGGFGRLLLLYGTGSFIGSFTLGSLRNFHYKGGTFAIGSMVWGTGWALFGLSQMTQTSYALMLLMGLASATFGVLQTPLMLMTSSAEVQGRALGILELAIGAMPIGSLGLGIIAGRFGVGPTTFVSGSLFVLILATYLLRHPDLVRYTGEEGI